VDQPRPREPPEGKEKEIMKAALSMRLYCALGVLGSAGAALACSMPLPPPPPEEPHHEIWCSSLRYNRATGKNEYLVGIEVTIMPPVQTTTCMCGVNISNVGLSASFRIISVDFVVANMISHDMTNISEFDGFAASEAVEVELEDLKDAIEDPFGTAFEAGIEPFEPPSLEPEDIEKMFFIVEFAPGDLPSMLGRPIQFAAGSDDPNHPLAVFTGYQTTVNFPTINICIGDPNSDGVTNFDDVTGARILTLDSLTIQEHPGGFFGFENFVFYAYNDAGQLVASRGFTTDGDGVVGFADLTMVLANGT
jgi:hypothetical protein